MSALAAISEMEAVPLPVGDAEARAPTDLRALVVRDREGFERIAAAWGALEAVARGAVFFQSRSWVRAVFDFEAGRASRSFDPVIATLWEDETLRAVLPLERVHDRTRSALVAIGHRFTQYSDVLIDPGLDLVPTVARLVREAARSAPADLVILLKVRADSVLCAGMPDDHVITGEPGGAPYVGLSSFSGYDAYFQTIKPKSRKNMRNARNRLEREGPLAHAVASDGEETRAVIERTIMGRAGRLRAQGLTSRAFADRAFLDFCTALPGRPDIELLASSLTHSGQPIAEQWGFVHNRRYYAFVATRDFANSEESPGKLHLGEIVRLCAARGYEGADLLMPVMPYKLTWATEVVEVRDHALALTPRGRLTIRLWDRFLRPRLKAVAMAMPARLRGAILRLMGRGG